MAGVTVTLRPPASLQGREGRRGRAPPTLPARACPSSSVSISLKSVPTCCVRSAGPEVRKTQGNAGERGAVCMGKHTSTCKNMIPLRNATWAHGKTRSQAAQGCRVSSLPPTAGTLCLVEGKACLGRPASPHLCQGGIHMLCWGREGMGTGREGGAVIYFFGHHPVSSGGQGSLFVNTPLPGSPGDGRKEQGGEGMREQNSGVQIPAGIL